jgi:hypothetical protein
VPHPIDLLRHPVGGTRSTCRSSLSSHEDLWIAARLLCGLQWRPIHSSIFFRVASEFQFGHFFWWASGGSAATTSSCNCWVISVSGMLDLVRGKAFLPGRYQWWLRGGADRRVATKAKWSES